MKNDYFEAHHYNEKSFNNLGKKCTELERLKQSKHIKTHAIRSIRRHLIILGHLPALNKTMEKIFFFKIRTE